MKKEQVWNVSEVVAGQKRYKGMPFSEEDARNPRITNWIKRYEAEKNTKAIIEKPKPIKVGDK